MFLYFLRPFFCTFVFFALLYFFIILLLYFSTFVFFFYFVFSVLLYFLYFLYFFYSFVSIILWSDVWTQNMYNKYYFESHIIYKWHYYRQTIFNRLNIMVSYVDIIGLCHSVAILWKIYLMRRKCHVRWLRFHFKRMLIKGLGQ